MEHFRLARIGTALTTALALGGCTAYGDQYGMSYNAPPPVAYAGGYEAPAQNQGYDQGGYDQGYDGQDGYDQGYEDGGAYADGTYDAYDAPYYAGGYYGQDYGYGFGWNDGFYYPGFGVYIYDRSGHRHGWRDRDRDYWRHHPRPRGTTPPHQGWHGGDWRGGNGSWPGRGNSWQGQDRHWQDRNGGTGGGYRSDGRGNPGDQTDRDRHRHRERFQGQGGFRPGQAMTPVAPGGRDSRGYYSNRGDRTVPGADGFHGGRGYGAPGGESFQGRSGVNRGPSELPSGRVQGSIPPVRPSFAPPPPRQWSGRDNAPAPRIEASRPPVGALRDAGPGRRHSED